MKYSPHEFLDNSNSAGKIEVAQYLKAPLGYKNGKKETGRKFDCWVEVDPSSGLDSQIPALLAQVALEPAEKDAYLAEARRVLQEVAPEGSGKEAETLEQQIKKLEQQRRNLVTLATDPDNGISADEFRQERERLNERIDQAQFTLRRLTQQREHAEENIAAALEGLVHLDRAYHDMPLKLRRELVRRVFRRLVVEAGEIVEVQYNRPFAFVARCKHASHTKSSDSITLGVPLATLSELLCD